MRAPAPSTTCVGATAASQVAPVDKGRLGAPATVLARLARLGTEILSIVPAGVSSWVVVPEHKEGHSETMC